MTFDILIIFGLFVFWALVSALSFKFLPCPEHLQPKHTGNQKNKTYYSYYAQYSTILHSNFVMILGIILRMTKGVTYGQSNTLLVDLALYNSLAYFSCEAILLNTFEYGSKALLINDIALIALTGNAACLQNSGNEVVAVLFLIHFCKPIGSVKELLKHFTLESSFIYSRVSLIFAGLFIITRFIVLPWQLVSIYSNSTNILIKILMAINWILCWESLLDVLSLIAKEAKNTQISSKRNGNDFGEAFHAKVIQLKNSKTFMGLYYTVATVLSFGALYMFNNRKVS